MTTIIDGSAGITFPNSTVQASAGSVLQTVCYQYPTFVSTASTSSVATGITASITPKFSTSKILVIATAAGVNMTGATNAAAHFEIYRNGSSVSYWDDIICNGAVNSPSFSTSITYLDSPASTSSTTYTIYWKRVGPGSSTIYLNNYEATSGQTVSSITLLEIA